MDTGVKTRITDEQLVVKQPPPKNQKKTQEIESLFFIKTLPPEKRQEAH